VRDLYFLWESALKRTEAKSLNLLLEPSELFPGGWRKARTGHNSSHIVAGGAADIGKQQRDASNSGDGVYREPD
jgi:hypothetical protein